MNKNLDILSNLDLSDITDLVRNAYRQEGYSGLFESTASFLFGDDNNNIQLFAPLYSQFMLYGRNPGKMPPSDAISNWMESVGITGSPWAIMNKIANEGTTGNDFLSPVLPEITEAVSKEIANVAGKNIANYLTYVQ